MRIKSIVATNFKGRSFETSLAPVTVLAGLNFAGKSSRIEALELALTGALHGVGSRSGDLHERLASGDDMRVSAALGDGQSVTRTYCKTRKGVTATCVPEGFALPAVMFDATEFLTLSAKERTKFLFRTLPPPDMTKVGPQAITAALKNVKLEPHTEHAEAAIDELCRFIEANHSEQVVSGGKLIQEWLDALVEDVRLKANAAVAGAKRMKETALGVTQLKGPDAASLAQCERVKREAQQAHEAAVAAEATAQAALEQARKDYAAAKAAADAWVDEGEAIQAVKEFELRIMELKLVPEAGERPGGKTMLEARPSFQTEEEVMNKAAKAFREASELYEANVRKFHKLGQELVDAKENTTCPCCGQDVTHKQAEVIAALDVQLEAVTKEGAILLQTEQATKAAYSEALAAFNKRFDEAKQWDQKRNELNTDNQVSREAWQKKQDAYNQAQAAINTAQAQINAWKEKLAANAQAAAAKASLPDLLNEGQSRSVAHQAAHTLTGELKRKLDEADAAHRQAVAQASAAQTARKAVEAADKAQAEADVTKALSAILVTLLATAVACSIQPMLDGLNALCGPLLKAPLAYQDGELGMVQATGFVTWRSFSGSEKALALAALSVALAAKSPVRLAVIDEVSRLDAERKNALGNVLVELVKSGKLDQCVIIDTDAGFWADKVARYNDPETVQLVKL